MTPDRLSPLLPFLLLTRQSVLMLVLVLVMVMVMEMVLQLPPPSHLLLAPLLWPSSGVGGEPRGRKRHSPLSYKTRALRHTSPP